MITHASVRPCEFGNGMLLQQNTSMYVIKWALSSYGTDIRNWKYELYNGRIFDKVSPAVLGRWTMNLKGFIERFWKTGY